MLENATGMKNLANLKSGTNTYVLYGEGREEKQGWWKCQKIPGSKAHACLQVCPAQARGTRPVQTKLGAVNHRQSSRGGGGGVGVGGGVCRSHWLSTDHRKMDARESYNYDKFTPSNLQLAPSPLSVSLFCEHILIDMQFTHNNPPPTTTTATTSSSSPPHWPILFPQQVHERVTNVCGKAPLYRASQQPTTTPIGSSISASLPETAFR